MQFGKRIPGSHQSVWRTLGVSAPQQMLIADSILANERIVFFAVIQQFPEEASLRLQFLENVWQVATKLLWKENLKTFRGRLVFSNEFAPWRGNFQLDNPSTWDFEWEDAPKGDCSGERVGEFCMGNVKYLGLDKRVIEANPSFSPNAN